jgi:hypothetical protein
MSTGPGVLLYSFAGARHKNATGMDRNLGSLPGAALRVKARRLRGTSVAKQIVMQCVARA